MTSLDLPNPPVSDTPLACEVLLQSRTDPTFRYWVKRGVSWFNGHGVGMWVYWGVPLELDGMPFDGDVVGWNPTL